MKDGLWCSHAAGPRIWWEVRHWWYNNISGQSGAAWRASPLGQFIHKARSYDDLLWAWHNSLGRINDLFGVGKELRKDKEILQEALQILYELAPAQLELLLAEAEANLGKRNQQGDDEPF